MKKIMSLRELAVKVDSIFKLVDERYVYCDAAGEYLPIPADPLQHERGIELARKLYKSAKPYEEDLLKKESKNSHLLDSDEYILSCFFKYYHEDVKFRFKGISLTNFDFQPLCDITELGQRTPLERRLKKVFEVIDMTNCNSKVFCAICFFLYTKRISGKRVFVHNLSYEKFKRLLSDACFRRNTPTANSNKAELYLEELDYNLKKELLKIFPN